MILLQQVLVEVRLNINFKLDIELILDKILYLINMYKLYIKENS